MLLLPITNGLADVIANVVDVIATHFIPIHHLYHFLPIHHLVLNSIEQHFPQTWKKPRWILAKACLTAKNIVLFKRNL